MILTFNKSFGLNTPFDDTRQIIVFGWQCHTKHYTITFFRFHDHFRMRVDCDCNLNWKFYREVDLYAGARAHTLQLYIYIYYLCSFVFLLIFFSINNSKFNSIQLSFLWMAYSHLIRKLRAAYAMEHFHFENEMTIEFCQLKAGILAVYCPSNSLFPFTCIIKFLRSHLKKKNQFYGSKKKYLIHFSASFFVLLLI